VAKASEEVDEDKPSMAAASGSNNNYLSAAALDPILANGPQMSKSP